MGIFISMLNWHMERCVDDVRRTIDRFEVALWAHGMHSIRFLPDAPDGTHAGVMVSTCAGHADAARIAEAILGEALTRIDTMLLDDVALTAVMPEREPALLAA